jgi:predicted ribonuclease YlaK
VPALDALIGEPKLINPDKDTKKKAGEMLIPNQYVDRLAEFLDEGITSRGEAAYILLNHITNMLSEIHDKGLEYYTCKNGMRIRFISADDQAFDKDDSRKSTKASTLATASYYNKFHPGTVAILSGDPAMLAKALQRGIDIARINPEIYTGRRKLVLPTKAYEKWFSKGYLTAEDFTKYFPDEKPLLYNEFVEFVLDEATVACYQTTGNCRELSNHIGRFEEEYGEDGKKTGEWTLHQLHHITRPKENSKEIPIEPLNAGQAMLYEALLAPDIDIVICAATFGTGKTYLSVNAGLNAVRDAKSQYDRVFICPRDPHWGEQIGFLPGDEHQKTLANAMPIVDNIRSGLKSKGDKCKNGEKKSNAQINDEVNKIIDDWCELTSMVHMGGRSLASSWIIYDEAQDFEWSQMLQLVERIGDYSKMVIIGDPEQVHNRHLSKNSCGLSRAMSKFAGGRCIAVVTLNKDEIERSRAAREISRLLNRQY